MELPTCSSIWNTKRIFYRFEDVPLPVPVAADVLLLAAVCFTVWDGFWWAVIGAAPFRMIFGGNVWFGVAACWYLLPPFFAARVMSRPNREGKNAMQAVASWARYLIRPKTFDGFVSRRHIKAWLKTRDARTQVTSTRGSAASRMAERLGRKKAAAQAAAGETMKRKRSEATAITGKGTAAFSMVTRQAGAAFSMAAKRAGAASSAIARQGKTAVQDARRKGKTVTRVIAREAAQTTEAARTVMSAATARTRQRARKPGPRHATPRNQQPDGSPARYRRIYLGKEIRADDSDENTAKR